MKADYKNWMPKGMVTGTGCGGGRNAGELRENCLRSIRLRMLPLSIILMFL